MNNEVISYIKSKWDCVTYARVVLGLPVYKAGDRCKSFRPDAERPDSLLVNEEHWVDFGADLRGDVIDLCAYALHNGDKGAAIRDLGADVISSFQPDKWKHYVHDFEQKIIYWHKSLRPEDIEYLHSRRINDDTIERLKIGYSANEQRLMFPYWKNGHYVYWIGRDRTGNPNASKYKKMYIDDFNEHVPWGLHSLKNPPKGKDYLITGEGMFDIASFEQEGYAVLSPICGHFSKPQEKIFLAAAKDFKCVFMCFDSDKPGTDFQMKLAKICFAHRIKFKCGHLPQGIKDVSDYYAAGGDLEFLINKATDGVAELVKTFNDREEFAEFLRSAARYIPKYDIVEACSHATQFPEDWVKALCQECTRPPMEKFIVEEVTKARMLKFIEASGFFEYNHGVWNSTPDNVIKSYAADQFGLFATGNRLSSVLGFIKARTTSQEEFNTQHIFNFVNDVVDLETGERKKHSPAFMSTVQADFEYSPSVKCPTFERFVREVMCDKFEKIQLLQEMCGYILFPDCSLQKCFFLMGDGSNGKSVLLNTLAAVIGKRNCSHVEISGLVSPFEPIRLRYALVNFSNETRSNIKEADEKFKAVVAGDPISAAFKGKDAIEFITRAKWICAANNYISANDINYSMMRRIRFIRFERTFKDKEIDPRLTEKLIAERQGIFNWIYEGYRRLRELKEFTATDEQVTLTEEFMQSISPIAAFFDEKLAEIYDEKFSSEDLYLKYCDWCKSSGCKPKNRMNFSRTVNQIIKQKRPDTQFTRSGSVNYVVFGKPQILGGI